MTEEDNPVEFSLDVTKLRLDELISKKKEKQKQIRMLINKKNFNALDEIKREELQNEVDSLENKINQIFERYNTLLTQSLYNESKKLSELTTVLIFLTAILSVSTILDLILRIV